MASSVNPLCLVCLNYKLYHDNLPGNFINEWTCSKSILLVLPELYAFWLVKWKPGLLYLKPWDFLKLLEFCHLLVRIARLAALRCKTIIVSLLILIHNELRPLEKRCIHFMFWMLAYSQNAFVAFCFHKAKSWQENEDCVEMYTVFPLLNRGVLVFLCFHGWSKILSLGPWTHGILRNQT